MGISIRSTPDNNLKGLQVWAAYIENRRTQPATVEAAAMAAPPRRVALASPAPVLRMDTGTLHSSSCACKLCSSPSMGTSGSGVGGGKIFKIQLSGELTEEQKEIVEHLRRRDAEVRRHEQAHLMAAGPYALGGPSYTYQFGPDGQRYAIGGEVQIDLSEEHTPEETLRKAQKLQQAALAPSDPSSADRQVAMEASRMAREAQQEALEKRRSEQLEEAAGGSGAPKTPEREQVDRQGQFAPIGQNRIHSPADSGREPDDYDPTSQAGTAGYELPPNTSIFDSAGGDTAASNQSLDIYI